MKTSSVVLAALASTAMACSGAVTPQGENDGAVASAYMAPGHLTVMTRNVYLGASIDPILAATSAEEVPILVAGAWGQLLGNDFATRARSIAHDIATWRPALVGLQEPALYHRFPADGSETQTLDFLAILQEELAAQGASYRVVVAQHTSDVVVPMFAGFDEAGNPLLDGLEMIDRDAILARADVTTSEPASGRYVQGLPLEVAGTPVEIVRGWTSVVAGPYRFVNTHLEDFVPEIQLAQGMELVDLLANETRPLVVVGDFNSRADGTGTPTYAYVTGSGFTDVWTRANHKAPGYTCCHADDLSVTPAPLYERIDLVLVRTHGRSIEAPVFANLVGTDMTPEGLWPSDHAGVVARFRIK